MQDRESDAVVVDSFAAVGDIRICYQTRGNPRDPALLLLMGFGTQLTGWDGSFCDAFVGRGYFVIRYDHRDIGLSSRLDGHDPRLGDIANGDLSSVAYTLYDMADDAAGLLDVLGVTSAHLLGASMGGMIAQAFAIRHPQRTLSLCSIMSTTGAAGLPGPTPEAIEVSQAGVRALPGEATIDATVAAGRVYAGGGFPFDEADLRRRTEAALARCDYPAGKRRHAAAVMATGDRTSALATVAAPTVVIHGSNDPLIPIECGRATADAIPGAEFVVIDGMGHELPPGARTQIIDCFVANARRSQ